MNLRRAFSITKRVFRGLKHDRRTVALIVIAPLLAMFVFGIAFQTPTAIFFLNKTGLVSIDTLSKSRKYVLLAIFIVAAFATPPDVVSQITLAIPLYLLFELGILLSYIANR